MLDFFTFCDPHGGPEGFMAAFIEICIYVGVPYLVFMLVDTVMLHEKITSLFKKLPKKRQFTIRSLLIIYAVCFSFLALYSNIQHGNERPKKDIDVVYDKDGEDYNVTNKTDKTVDFFDVVIADTKPENAAKTDRKSEYLLDTSVKYMSVKPKKTLSTSVLGVDRPYDLPPATLGDIIEKLSGDIPGFDKDDSRVVRITNYGSYADMNLPLHDNVSRKCEIWTVLNNSDGNVNISALDNRVCDDVFHSVPAHHFLTQ